MAVQEGHDLRTGADGIRTEGGIASALGDALLDRPQHCVTVVRIRGDIRESGGAALRDGRAGGAP